MALSFSTIYFRMANVFLQIRSSCSIPGSLLFVICLSGCGHHRACVDDASMKTLRALHCSLMEEAALADGDVVGNFSQTVGIENAVATELLENVELVVLMDGVDVTAHVGYSEEYHLVHSKLLMKGSSVVPIVIDATMDHDANGQRIVIVDLSLIYSGVGDHKSSGDWQLGVRLPLDN